MNLDLIIKLVKLANNNPNENESNLAARKVCKLIAEGNYKFSIDAPPIPTSVFDWGRDLTNWREPPRYTKSPEPKKYNPLEKKTIRCTKCGNMILTGFVGPPQVFVCTACQ